MLWHRIANTLHRRTYADPRDLDVCSSLLAEAWTRQGFDFNEYIHTNNMSPNDIYTSKIVDIKGELYE